MLPLQGRDSGSIPDGSTMIECDFTIHPEVILGGMSSSQGINYYSSPSGLGNKVMPKPEMVLTTGNSQEFPIMFRL